MPVTPFSIVGIWFRGLLSIAVIVGGIALLRAWYDDAHVRETGRPVAVEARRDAPPEAPPDGRPRAEVERVEDARPA